MVVFIPLSWDRIMFCCSGCHKTCYIDQAGLKLVAMLLPLGFWDYRRLPTTSPSLHVNLQSWIIYLTISQIPLTFTKSTWMQILSCGEKSKVSGCLRFSRVCSFTGPWGHSGVEATIAFSVLSQEAGADGKKALRPSSARIPPKDVSYLPEIEGPNTERTMQLPALGWEFHSLLKASGTFSSCLGSVSFFAEGPICQSRRELHQAVLNQTKQK